MNLQQYAWKKEVFEGKRDLLLPLCDREMCRVPHTWSRRRSSLIFNMFALGLNRLKVSHFSFLSRICVFILQFCPVNITQERLWCNHSVQINTSPHTAIFEHASRSCYGKRCSGLSQSAEHIRSFFWVCPAFKHHIFLMIKHNLFCIHYHSWSVKPAYLSRTNSIANIRWSNQEEQNIWFVRSVSNVSFPSPSLLKT